MTSRQSIIGVIPAAGKAERVQPLPCCSKELLPIDFRLSNREAKPRAHVVMGHLLEGMRCAGAEKIFVVLRKGKWDIPHYLGSGEAFGLKLAYLVTEVLDGVPFTVDRLYPFFRGRDLVLFGFPDIVYRPADAFGSLIRQLRASNSDLTLGLFPSPQPASMDMVETDKAGQVVSIQIKPARTKLKHTWIMAVWGKRFCDFLHEYLRECLKHLGSKIGGAEL